MLCDYCNIDTIWGITRILVAVCTTCVYTCVCTV